MLLASKPTKHNARQTQPNPLAGSQLNSTQLNATPAGLMWAAQCSYFVKAGTTVKTSMLGCWCAHNHLAVSICVHNILAGAFATEHPPGPVRTHTGAALCAAHDSTVVDVAGAVHVPTLAAGHHNAVVEPDAVVTCAHARFKLAGDAGAIWQPVAGVWVIAGRLHGWWWWQGWQGGCSAAGAAATALRHQTPEHGQQGRGRSRLVVYQCVVPFVTVIRQQLVMRQVQAL